MGLLRAIEEFPRRRREDKNREREKHSNEYSDTQRSERHLVNSLPRILSQIEAFLALGQEGERYPALRAALKQCFDEWLEVQRLSQENEAADIVLGACYKNGKILDLLQRIKTFAAQIEETDDPALTALEGYNNYAYFLQRHVEELKESYAAHRSGAASGELSCDIKTVSRFIQSECQSIPSVRELPQAREIAKTLIACENLDRRPLTREERIGIGKVTGALELLDGWQEDMDELELLKQDFEQRKEAMRANIERGTALYHTITSILTEAWFRRLDPAGNAAAADNPIKRMTAMEIKALYLEALAEIEEKLSDETSACF